MPQSEQNKYMQRGDQHDPQTEDPKTDDAGPQQTVAIALPPQDAATPVPEPGRSDRSEFVVCKTGYLFLFISYSGLAVQCSMFSHDVQPQQGVQTYISDDKVLTARSSSSTAYALLIHM